MNRKERKRQERLAQLGAYSGERGGRRSGSKKGYRKGCFGSSPKHGLYPPYRPWKA